MAPPSSHPRHSTPPASSDETTPRSEDEDGGVSTDVFADFDIPSDTDRAFLREHLPEAPKDDVAFLLNTCKAPQGTAPAHTKSSSSTPKPQPRDVVPGTPRSLLKYHERRAIIAEHAQKHAAETLPGAPSPSQLEGYLKEIQKFALGLGLGVNQALFEAKRAQEDLCKAKGIKLESKMAAVEMPGLELTDAIEVLANVQQAVGNLFDANGLPQDTGAVQTTAPTKRKRFRRDPNTPKVESDVGGTPVSEAATTDTQPEKVMLNDRRSKRQKANIAAVAMAAEFAKLNPEAPKMTRRERKIAFIQNKAKEAAANTLAVAPTTVTEAAVAVEAKLSELGPEVPKKTSRERKLEFIQNKAKAKAEAANELPIAPTTILEGAVTAEAESVEVAPEAPKLTRRERKAAFIQNKAKAASTIDSPAAPTTVLAVADTQADPALNPQIAQLIAKEYESVSVMSPLSSDAAASDTSTTAALKSRKMLKKEERTARRILERQAAGVVPTFVADGDKLTPSKPAITTPTRQANATDMPTPAVVKADNEVATEEPSKKRKRGAKNKPNPASGDPGSATTAPVLSQSKPSTVAVPNAPKPVVAADDGFIDLRAPKKKKRARKSTTTANGGSDSNTPEVAKTDAIKPEAAAPVESKNTQPAAQATPFIKEEVNEGDAGTNAAGKRKRKRGPPPPKKALDIPEQNPATSAPVDVAVPEPMELCVDEPVSKPVPATMIPATQPLSEIPAPNPVSNKRRKRGNRKSVSDENKTGAPVTVDEPKEHHS